MRAFYGQIENHVATRRSATFHATSFKFAARRGIRLGTRRESGDWNVGRAARHDDSAASSLILRRRMSILTRGFGP